MLSRETLLNLHNEMKSALAEGGTDFSPHAKFRSIWRHFDGMSDDPLYLEVLIMAGLYARARPSPMRQAFRKLRRMRVAKGELDHFIEFERVLETNSQGYFLNNHGYSKERLGDLEPEVVFSGLGAHIEDLNSLGLEAFVNSGTLLGLVREGGLIKYDDDVDLCVFLESASHEDAASEFLELGRLLAKQGHANPLRNVRHGMLKMNSIAGLNVDLFPAYQVQNRVYVYPYSFGDLSAGDLFPLVPCIVSKLPIPQHSEAVLEANYGKDWRTPVQLFEFPWAAQAKKFEAFLSALRKN